jgi:hypothetical protein
VVDHRRDNAAMEGWCFREGFGSLKADIVNEISASDPSWTIRPRLKIGVVWIEVLD